MVRLGPAVVQPRAPLLHAFNPTVVRLGLLNAGVGFIIVMTFNPTVVRLGRDMGQGARLAMRPFNPTVVRLGRR